MTTPNNGGKRKSASASADRENRLLIVGNFLSATRVTRGVCEDLALRLSEKNWNVLTTSPRDRRVTRLLDMVSTAWRQRASYEVAQVDVYSGAAFMWAQIVCWVLRRAGKPYILTLHGGDLPRFSRRRPGRVRRLLGSASAVTVPSRYLLEEMKVYRKELRLLPNGIDLNVYRFRSRERPGPQLVWLRAFHEIYNPTLAPRVLTLLQKEFPDVRLSMFGFDKGDGSWHETRRVAAELGVSDRILWSGGVPKEDVPAVLQKADVFLNTTNFDNSPVSVMEALACGLCVVSTDAGGLPYLLTNEQDALLVPRGDAEAMANAVARILRDPELAERLSRNGRQLSERSDWSRVLPQWQQLITTVREGWYA
jgi:glycosyltransferase involved in cell wall biosynthesis